ncbi:potassium channel family protein [Vibrio nitrifigilis]|uniref:Two pore domain potassium channel family protein n=1 Tax=Vibrio nitrifigilis TaxID=2789781 RepID=A0ABS0GBG5_9VIBR|nr:potassium channel family protein [Vibrio nitrifigilis]MBF8999758.1 two pore domain potassium channel family protein [Vibrio nitrifigilis]
MHILKRISVLVALHLQRVTWLGILVTTLFHYGICWLTFNALGENELTQIPRFFYFMNVTGSTVGYGDYSPITTAGQQFLAWYQMPVSIALFGVVLAKISSQIRDFIERNIKGMKDFAHYQQHVIIIGWHVPHTKTLVDCILADKKRENGRIILAVEDETMLHPLQEYKEVDFAVVSSFADSSEQQRLALNTANRVIIYDQNDERTLTTALSIANQVKDECHIVAYFNDAAKAALLDKHYKNIECSTNRAAELLARSMQDPGASRVLNQLLSPNIGATQYTLKVPDIEPVSVAEISRYFKEHYNAMLIAIAHMQSGDDVVLNPAPETLVTSGMYLHYIASERLHSKQLDWQCR